MPAKIKLDDIEITAALRYTGGAVAAAAHLLNIHPRTLQRRLKQHPALWPDFGYDPVWEAAMQRSDDREEALLYTPEFKFLRAKKQFDDAVQWYADDVDMAPQVMSPAEVSTFLAEIKSGVVYELKQATVAETMRSIRPRARRRKL